jgi:hypothetical protein
MLQLDNEGWARRNGKIIQKHETLKLLPIGDPNLKNMVPIYRRQK